MFGGGEHRVFDVAASEGKLLHLRSLGRNCLAVLESELESVPAGGLLYIDLRGVEFLDYSFSDTAFGTVISRAARGDYGDRRAILLDEDRDLLENIEMSLRERDVNAFRVERVGGEPHLLGRLEEHLVETLEAIRTLGPITTADLARRLGINQTACNNRTSNLHERGLVNRRKEASGRRYFYEGIV